MLASATPLVLLERVTRAQIDSEAAERVRDIADAASRGWASGGENGALAILNGELQVPGPLVVLMQDGRGDFVTGNLITWPAGLVADGRLRRIVLLHQEDDRMEPYLVLSRRLGGDYRLLVGRSLEAEEKLLTTLAGTLSAALLLALGLSWLASRRITLLIDRRARTIADVVGAVTEGDLSRRVPVPSRGRLDSFDAMGSAFNVMLARIEALLDELRAVTDGLAHDLRSPLTRLKARIDRLGVQSVVDAADLQAVSAESDALLAMLDNSLEISRAEAGIGRDSFSHIDLAEMVTDLAEMYEPLAEDSGVRLTALTVGPVPALAHRQLLGRALSNLIDNALRYGASGDSIELVAMKTADGARLLVADHGPGIPAGSRREALRRFGRLDSARPSGSGVPRGPGRQGAGLGLSLAAAVARLHGGTLTLADNAPGLKVAIDLPGPMAAE
jgi:signal transduction histidine kinase